MMVEKIYNCIFTESIIKMLKSHTNLKVNFNKIPLFSLNLNFKCINFLMFSEHTIIFIPSATVTYFIFLITNTLSG